ncbi:MAG: AMP-binding protein, partial [Geminicoccales bacterium]
EVELAMVGRFSASRFWSEAQAARASHIHYLGGVLQLLLKQPPGRRDRAHGVRIAWGGGCPRPIWTPFEERFGVAIRECYGMTEASSITTYNDRGPVGSVGRAVPWFEVAIADQRGHPLAPGAQGEIVVRQRRPGALFAGYWDDPAASAAALRDGALHTGDLGSIDAAGNLTFYGRITDSVRCGGENVSAWEVEHTAAGHPQVEACAMVGVPSELGEQDIKLFVKPRPGQSIEVAQLAAWLAERLAPYQTPRYIALVEAFAQTPSQRIMKHKLSRDTDCFDRRAARSAR